jgi:hypothetical protein
MTTNSNNSRPNHNSSRHRAQQLAAFLGLVAAATDLSDVGASTAAAQPALYRSAAEVPASWRDFAMELQTKLQARLTADAKAVGKIADGMRRLEHSDDATPGAIIVRAWMSPSGKIQRLVFDDLNGDVVTVLHTLLDNDDVGLPPPDMLQPVHLRLSLRTKFKPGRQQ